MRRLTALLLGIALVATTSQLSALHVHIYTDHDHHEHHHGFAAHRHDRPASHTHDGGPTLRARDPDQHVLSFVMVWTTARDLRAVAGAIEPAMAVPEARQVHVTGLTDVRVHGPPARSHAAPRAPPRIVPA